jgi:hypothetical protein
MLARTVGGGLVALRALALPAAAAPVGPAPDTLTAIVADYETLARQTDGQDGPGWPDVSELAADRRAGAFATLRTRLAALPPTPSASQESLTRRLLDWRLDMLVQGARFDEDRIPFDNGDGFFNTANQLGDEMGVYRTAYEQVGRLSFDMWRACRLLVDVGIHWKGWSAERAEQCLRDNTTLLEGAVRYEIQRYVAWPAQALAYKVGELEILRMRQRAERQLGARFDIRAFHDALLDDGPMLMAILAERLEAWVAAAGDPH